MPSIQASLTGHVLHWWQMIDPTETSSVQRAQTIGLLPDRVILTVSTGTVRQQTGKITKFVALLQEYQRQRMSACNVTLWCSK